MNSDPGFESKPHPLPRVRRIATKILWAYYLVGVSHFAEYRENQPVTLSEMLMNIFLKSPIPQE